MRRTDYRRLTESQPDAQANPVSQPQRNQWQSYARQGTDGQMEANQVDAEKFLQDDSNAAACQDMHHINGQRCLAQTGEPIQSEAHQPAAEHGHCKNGRARQEQGQHFVASWQ